jgi:hypothetical protein
MEEAAVHTRASTRKTNERMAELASRVGGAYVVVNCECGDPSCALSARLKLAAWQELCRHPELFVLAPDHDDSPAATIAARGAGYWLGRARR